MLQLFITNRAFVIFFMGLSLNTTAQITASDTVRVYFAFDKFTLSGAEQQRLVNMLDRWKHDDDTVRFYLNSYTDSVGTVNYNHQLAKRRANYVQNILRDQLAMQHLKMITNVYGEEFQSVASDSMNRNVTIVIKHNRSEAASKNNKVAPIPSGNQVTASDSDYLVEPQKDSLKVDTVIPLKNIQFIEDRPYLTPEAYGAMPAYVRLIRRLGFDHMEVVGYYYYEGNLIRPNDPRFKLSVKRAKVVSEIFIDAGLDSSKISWRGAGNSQLVVKDAITVDDMRKNIRVEVVLYSNSVRLKNDASTEKY